MATIATDTSLTMTTAVTSARLQFSKDVQALAATTTHAIMYALTNTSWNGNGFQLRTDIVFVCGPALLCTVSELLGLEPKRSCEQMTRRSKAGG